MSDHDDEPPTRPRLAGCLWALVALATVLVVLMGGAAAFLVVKMGNPGPLPARGRPTAPVKAEPGPPPRVVEPAGGDQPGQPEK